MSRGSRSGAACGCVKCTEPPGDAGTAGMETPKRQTKSNELHSVHRKRGEKNDVSLQDSLQGKLKSSSTFTVVHLNVH